MASSLFWLSDEAWAAFEPHFPKNKPGARRVDGRRVISGILHVLKVRCCDCPADYGLITECTDQYPCAQWRKPIDMMCQGWSTSLFQAKQQ